MPNPKSGVPQFGRAWHLTVKDTSGKIILDAESKTWLPEPLHITFDVYQTIQAAYWFADIGIFNLNSPSEQNIIEQGFTVKLEAGYQSQPYGIIFEGTIFQPLWERINGIDFKLTLHCVVGLVENSSNFINLTLASGLSQREIVSRMASSARYPLDTSNVSELGPIKQSRSSTHFGQPGETLQSIASDSEQTLWFTNQAINIQKLLQSTSVPTLNYSPENGLVGTPQQTQDGVVMKVLLDARATLRTQIKLSVSTSIRQLPKSIPSYPTILDKDGLYVIGAVRHYGDSRGQDWYSEITGFVYAGSILALQTNF